MSAAESTTLPVGDPASFKRRALRWASRFPFCIAFDSNGRTDDLSAIDWMLGVDVGDRLMHDADGGLDALDDFLARTDGYRMGWLGYGLARETERLNSRHVDDLGWPVIHMVRPRYTLRLTSDRLTIDRNTPEALAILDAIDREDATPGTIDLPALTPTVGEVWHRERVEAIRAAIARGDVYEVNLCLPWEATAHLRDPASTFLALNERARAPFSAFIHDGPRTVLCLSPERFLARRGRTLVSQPIKGTARRDPDPRTDHRLAEELVASSKERAENLMIADLVRNDLARCSVPGSVEVVELCAIHSFPTVHQMISTIRSRVLPHATTGDILRATAPMGSMTGAPKRAAIQTIDRLEATGRGLYAGSIGYVGPDEDMDWNVVIRTLLRDGDRLRLHTGGAITYDSVTADEWAECRLKTAVMHPDQ